MGWDGAGTTADNVAADRFPGTVLGPAVSTNVSSYLHWNTDTVPPFV